MPRRITAQRKNASSLYCLMRKNVIESHKGIVNKTFVKMMDELGYDVELTYKRKSVEAVAV